MYIGAVCVSIYVILCYTGIGHGKTFSSTNDTEQSASKSLIHVYNGTISPLTNLSSILFRNYDSGVRPYCPGDEEIIDLSLDLAVRQLIDLGWRDCQLTWDPNEFAGITLLRVPYSRLWIPDIALYERVSDEFYGLKDYPVLIYSDGLVEYNFPSTVEVLCPVDVTNFPFDTQVCSLKFSSWAYHGFHLNITSNAMAADLIPYPYPDVTFSIFIERKPDYYVNNILIPSFLITCIAILGFFLPVDCGEKVALELTVMLAISVFQLLVADKLPPSSDSTPWIVVYFNFTLFLSGTASLIQVIVLNLHYRADEKMSDWIVFKVLQPLAIISLTNVPGFTPLPWKSKQDDNIEKKGITTPEDAQLWILLAKCVDRLGLMIFLLVFLIGTVIIFTAVTS
ncbi:CHRNA10 [Mytilus coruscus]|uniref:CHRNA10 n=1 Tax=Mytilus coruscus TaxID=42192 RepID=A0A6J8CSX0_MYTCO|nr:CHRNA10 [Mytilus coruscus]